MEEGLDQRRGVIVRTSIVGIIANVLLATFKAVIGVAVRSTAMVSDALNNLSDVFSSAITIVGIKIASRPADKEHPFGHGQAEYIGSVLVAVIILFTGIESFADGLQAIISHTPASYDTIAIMVVATSVLVKVLLGKYMQRCGRKVHSESLIGSGTDALFDALASSSILVSAALSLLAGIDIDGWLAMGISVLILRAGVEILKESADHILGKRISGDYARSIRSAISRFSGVLACSDLILSVYGPELTIGSVHITVPDNLHARDIDTLSRKIQHMMLHDYGILMTLGIRAYNSADPMSAKMHDMAHELAEEYPDILQMHGFYANPRTKHVSFDVILDFNCKDRQRVKNELIAALSERFPDYTFHVTLDRDFSD